MSQTRVDWIRGITIRQPWATCILTGDKTIENRPSPGWPRGLYLLHAGLAAVERTALRLPLVATTIRGRQLERGAVIGVARLADVHPDDGPCTPWAEPGRFHLLFTDVQELALPIPIQAGALGPWRPTQDLVDQVRLQLPDLHAPEGTS
ncbi:hypothetical protein OG497_39340 [Streptomyces sp. NBC_01242]|uniref:hypothetical protein n=1 Tax=Streptomyces sp. NBC_01242 TaxID=2903795 RepID=UPI0022556755|nr:hypothetical protein [Streptomyces sp. NBC_01242]MCX4799898.1 hypothetical protein [Streptomyces sp. NBC_01242]